ncbi:hypothetical protein IAT38_001718 [Cryptococcus sp. DSM 104549]
MPRPTIPSSFFTNLASSHIRSAFRSLPTPPRLHRPLRFCPRPHSRPAASWDGTKKQTTTQKLLQPTTIVLIFVPILTGFLGVWQIKRLQWKLNLIEEVDRNLSKAPMLLPNSINLAALPDFSYRRVMAKGHFTGPPILLGPHTYDGIPGYHLILPLVRDGGSTILVNRGFITTTRAQAIRAGEVPDGLAPDGGPSKEEIVVEGLLPSTGQRTRWSPDNNLETNEWFWKDVEGMAEYVGGKEKNVQPVLVDAIDESDNAPTMMMQKGSPVGRPPHVELRNQHAQYAFIWLSLSGATTCMLGYVLTKGRRSAGPKRPKLY